MEDRARRMAACDHGTSECAQWQEYQGSATLLRQEMGRPQADTCCFRCLLPTKVCRGSLDRADGTSCFSPDLMKIFWVVVREYRGDLAEDPDGCVDTDLLAQVEKKVNILEKRWEEDIEMVLGAVLFYGFALTHWYKYPSVWIQYLRNL